METMTWILLLLLIASLDTLIGNRVLPFKTGVVKTGDSYSVYKWNRVFLIPIRMWILYGQSVDDYDRVFFEFGSFSSRNKFSNKDKAISVAKLHANQLYSTEEKEEVWSSWNSKTTDTEDSLTLQLGQALIEGRKEDEIKIMSRLKELNYI
jgi:hypothetical protein